MVGYWEHPWAAQRVEYSALHSVEWRVFQSADLKAIQKAVSTAFLSAETRATSMAAWKDNQRADSWVFQWAEWKVCL